MTVRSKEAVSNFFLKKKYFNRTDKYCEQALSVLTRLPV